MDSTTSSQATTKRIKTEGDWEENRGSTAAGLASPTRSVSGLRADLRLPPPPPPPPPPLLQQQQLLLLQPAASADERAQGCES
jgi:hypothetical protein